MIIDDERDERNILEELLRYEGYDVLPAPSGEAALGLLSNMPPENLPDLIILDARMPDMDGLEVCQRLKSNPRTRRIPILMFSVAGAVENKVDGLQKGADDYLSKTAANAELLARIHALLRRFKKKPFEPADEFLLNIYCRPGSEIRIQWSGDINVTDVSSNPLNLYVEEYSRYADDLPTDKNKWRSEAKRLGVDLFKKIASEHTNIFKVYSQASMVALTSKRHLHVKILSDRDFLRIPVECLFVEGEYLCRRQPLARSIEGVLIIKQPVSPSFFNGLHKENEPLRILLIAANTIPSITCVDEEVLTLKKSIYDAFTAKGISVAIKVIPSCDATYENVRREIRDSTYHIVHYSGHGNYDTGSAERSCLYPWKDSPKNETEPLSAAELQSLVVDSDIRFFYLSCCLGTATGAKRQLLDYDFLGIADALIQAAIPSVLGFRWPVTDHGAAKLAEKFYESLARHGQLDVALLEARKSINRDDLTWLSPVLITQK